MEAHRTHDRLPDSGSDLRLCSSGTTGRVSTYLVSQTLSNGWRRTLPAALSPLISDGPIILLVLLVLSHVPAGLQQVLRFAGGVFLLYLAAGAWKTWRKYTGTVPAVVQSPRQSLLRAAVVNLLNPNPYLGWSLVLGPLLLKGWHETPAHGIALVVGFYLTMILTLAAIIMLFAAAQNLGPRVNHALIGASAVGLACFGLYQLWSGTRGLW
jgi:threonine/homoserine/homoserine lactone efflux protein